MLWASYTPADVTWPQGPGPGGPYTAVLAGADAWALPGPVALPYAQGYPAAPGYPPYASAPAYLPLQRAAARQPARQWACPSCGAVAPPVWTVYGQPVCPSCGGPMAVGRGGPIRGAAAP